MLENVEQWPKTSLTVLDWFWWNVQGHCDGTVENMFLNDPCVPHQSREENKKQVLAAKREKRKEKRKKKKEEQKRKQDEEEEEGGQKTNDDFYEMQEQKEDSAEGNGLCSLSTTTEYNY